MVYLVASYQQSISACTVNVKWYILAITDLPFFTVPPHRRSLYLCSFLSRIYQCTHHECQLGKRHSSQTTGSRTTCLSNIILYTASILHYASAEPIKLHEPHGQPVDAVHSCMSVCTIPSFPIQASIIENIKCSCDFLQWAEGTLVDFHTHTPHGQPTDAVHRPASVGTIQGFPIRASCAFDVDWKKGHHQ